MGSLFLHPYLSGKDTGYSYSKPMVDTSSSFVQVIDFIPPPFFIYIGKR